MVTRPRDCSWVPHGFENITSQDFKCASDPENDYNCIAWAAGKTDTFWWPRPLAPYHWPHGLPRHPLQVAETIPNFIAAFKTEGYRPCRSGRFSFRYEKIALYVADNGRPKHAARLLPTGVWSSKLGPDEDIEHRTLKCIEGKKYGKVRVYLKRKWPEDQTPKLLIFRSFLSKLFGRAHGKFSPIPKENPTAS